MKTGAEKNVLGNFKLSENVISTIVATAASEVTGVKCVSDICGVQDLLQLRGFSKCTKIKFSEGAIMVDLYIKVRPETDVKSTAQEVQANVKSAVQNITGFAVPRVNVIVVGLFNDAVECPEVDA